MHAWSVRFQNYINFKRTNIIMLQDIDGAILSIKHQMLSLYLNTKISHLREVRWEKLLNDDCKIKKIIFMTTTKMRCLESIAFENYLLCAIIEKSRPHNQNLAWQYYLDVSTKMLDWHKSQVELFEVFVVIHCITSGLNHHFYKPKKLLWFCYCK